MTALVLIPFAAALGLLLLRDPRRARIAGAAVAAAMTALCALLVARSMHGEVHERGPALPFIGARWHLAADTIGASLATLAAIAALAMLIGLPQQVVRRSSAGGLLAMLGACIGAYLARDLALLCVFWIASFVPAGLDMRRAPSLHVRRRLRLSYGIYAGLASLFLIAGAAFLGWARAHAGAAAPLDLTAPSIVAAPQQQIAFVLLAIPILIRQGTLPFHSWMPALVDRGPVKFAAMTLTAPLGALLVLRVVLPLLPDAARMDLPLLAVLALAGALYTAFVALAQTRIRRALGFVSTSQAATVLVGSTLGGTSFHGALLQALAIGLSATCLLLTTAQLAARTGTDESERLGSLGQRFPRLAAAFLVGSLASIGMPGSLQYVAEDVLLHGLLPRHPIVTAVLLLATALQGIALLRMFLRVFYGPEREKGVVGPGLRDLLPREALAVFALLTLSAIAALQPLSFGFQP